MNHRHKKTFLVEFWATVFKLASYISLFNLIRSLLVSHCTFRSSHIRDTQSLLSKMRDRTDEVSIFLCGYLDENAKQRLSTFKESTRITRKYKRIVLQCLNKALIDERLYTDERFKKHLIPPSLKSSVLKETYIEEARRINRQLLEIAYPEELESYISLAGRFVDFWILSNLIAAIISAVFLFVQRDDLWNNRMVTWLASAMVLYGFLRVFEIVTYQTNVLLFDHYRASVRGLSYKLQGYRRIVLCLLHNYAEIILWFATSYLYFAYEIKLDEEGSRLSLIEAISDSFLMMIGEPAIKPSKTAVFLPVMVLGQALVGVFMTLLSLARFISLIPTPGSLDDTEAESNEVSREDYDTEIAL